jgi:HNH endonuclease
MPNPLERDAQPPVPKYTKPEIPYGYCNCGCGEKTPLAPANDVRYGVVKGQPNKFIRGHARSRTWVPLPPRDNPDIPVGLCQCGCGGSPAISDRADKTWGYVKGSPRRYLPGHQHRLSSVDYIVEDRGYATPCWIWQLATVFRGYGRIRVNGKQIPAHLFMYEKVRGVEVEKGLDMDHLCRVHRCVNPDHLEPVSREVNMQRGCRTKLTPDLVREMRTLGAQGVSYAYLGRKYHISWQQCREICLRKSWKNID